MLAVVEDDDGDPKVMEPTAVQIEKAYPEFGVPVIDRAP
jgi:hypothetical protein